MGYDKRDLDNDIGNSFYNDEKYVEALPYYEKCLEEDTSYVSYYNLGTCHFQLKDYDKALELLSVAESKEDDEEVLGFISDIHFEREDYEKAMEYAEKALELNRRNASRYDQRAKIYEKMGEEKEAINNYLTSISLYPQDCAIYKKLTALYNAIGDTAKASEFEKKAKELMCEEE
ncbi:MAG: tetratricopeptide repeat protein [Bacteroidota bacterium]